MLPTQGAQVQSPVRALRSQRPHSTARKKEKDTKQEGVHITTRVAMGRMSVVGSVHMYIFFPRT